MLSRRLTGTNTGSRSYFLLQQCHPLLLIHCTLQHRADTVLIINYHFLLNDTRFFCEEVKYINITAFIIQRNSIQQELKEISSRLGLMYFTVYARNDN